MNVMAMAFCCMTCDLKRNSKSNIDQDCLRQQTWDGKDDQAVLDVTVCLALRSWKDEPTGKLSVTLIMQPCNGGKFKENYHATCSRWASSTWNQI